MPTIAILSNSAEEREKIRKTMLSYSGHKDELQFVEYSVTDRHKADLMGEVDGDVQAGAIQLLIASDWLETGWDEFSSAELIAFCHQATPGFPFVILTSAEIPDTDKQNILATHIYPVDYFFGQDEDIVRRMVAEIDKHL
mgnify:CR=1 FL=1